MATTTRTGPVVLFVLGAMSAAVSGTPRRDAELHLTPLCHLENSKPALYTRGKKLVKLIELEAGSSEVADRILLNPAGGFPYCALRHSRAYPAGIASVSACPRTHLTHPPRPAPPRQPHPHNRLSAPASADPKVLILQ